jgi:hypothetical protein
MSKRQHSRVGICPQCGKRVRIYDDGHTSTHYVLGGDQCNPHAPWCNVNLDCNCQEIQTADQKRMGNHAK